MAKQAKLASLDARIREAQFNVAVCELRVGIERLKRFTREAELAAGVDQLAAGIAALKKEMRRGGR